MKGLTEILEAIKLGNKEISDIKEYSIEIGSINMSGFIDRVQKVEGVSGDSLLSEPDLNTDIRAVDIRNKDGLVLKIIVGYKNIIDIENMMKNGNILHALHLEYETINAYNLQLAKDIKIPF